MHKIHALLIASSQSLWRFALLLISFVISLRLLLRISTAFAAVTHGYEPFDMQNGLTIQDIAEQLGLYGAESRRLYGWFTLVDYAFPLLGGLLSATVIAFGLRRLLPDWHTRLLARQGYIWLLLPTFFDWAENVGNLLLIMRYPPLSEPIAQWMLRCKQAKLLSVFTVQGLALVLFVAVFAMQLRNLVRKRSTT